MSKRRDWPAILRDAEERRLTYGQICKEQGVTYSAVWQARQKYGIHMSFWRRSPVTMPAPYVPQEGVEEWRPVYGLEDRLEVSSEGRLRNVRTGNVLTPYLNPSNDYLYVNFHFNGRTKCIRVNRAVAQAFITNPLGLEQANHEDLDRLNNRATNLTWMTRRENCQHAGRAGRNHGGTNPRKNYKLTPEKVVEIKARRAAGEDRGALAREYGVSDSYLYNICRGARRVMG